VKPDLAASTVRIFHLALGEMLWSRRTLFMAALVAGPVFLAIVSRLASASGSAVLIVNGERVGGAQVFGAIIWTLFPRFIVPALGVFYGTSLIADEVEDKSITYLFVRPIPRGSIVLGKYLAYLVCASAVVLPSVTVAFMLMVPFGGMAAAFVPLVRDLLVLAIGLAVYGAVFVLAGVVLKRPLVAGLVFVFFWEQLALVLPGYLKYFTVAYYLQTLVPQSGIGSNASGVSPPAPGSLSPEAASVVLLAAIAVASLALAMRSVERREYVLEQ